MAATHDTKDTREMKTQDLELTIAAFLANQQNLLILGGPGMGKTLSLIHI